MPTTPHELPHWSSDQTIVGSWWPADQPEHRFPGTLRIEGGRPRLTVTAPPVGGEIFALGKAGTIHGESADKPSGRKITLWAHKEAPLLSAPGSDYSRECMYAILGEHSGAYDAETFRSSAASFHDLATWGHISDLIPEGTAEDDAEQHTTGILDEVYKDIFDTRHRVHVRLEHPQRVETSEDFPRGIIRNFRGDAVRVVFDVDPPAPAQFHELLLRDMQALLTFSYQAAAPVTGRWIGAESGTLLPAACADMFRHGTASTVGDFQMVLTTQQAPFGQLVESWWRVVDEVFPATQVITMHLSSSRGPLEQSTASVLAAIEQLHATVGATQHRLESDYLDARLHEILAQYPGPEHAPFRAYLKEKFKDNRPTLRTRLLELIDLAGADRLTAMGIDTVTWIARFKDVRDKLAHTGAHVPLRGNSGDDLALINGQSRLVLTLLLVTQMKLHESVIDRAAQVLAKWPHRIEGPSGR